MNTYKSIHLNYFIYRIGTSYIAACKELGIVIEHKSSYLAKRNLLNSIKSYVRNIKKHKHWECFLNQSLPEEILFELKERQLHKDTFLGILDFTKSWRFFLIGIKNKTCLIWK